MRSASPEFSTGPHTSDATARSSREPRGSLEREWLPVPGESAIPSTLRHRPRARSIVLPLVVLVPGLVLSVMLYVWTDNYQTASLARDFTSLAQEREHRIHETISVNMQKLLSTAALFDASSESGVSRSAFRRFARPLLADRLGVRALEWVPRVRRDEKKLYESRAKLEGIAFGIRPVNRGQSADNEATRDHFPVFYIAPRKNNEAAYGIDLASNPVRREALERARDTGLPAATAPLELVQDTEHAKSTLVFVPLYSSTPKPATVDDRRERLIGFVLGVFRLPDLLLGATAYLDTEDISVALMHDTEVVAGRAPDAGRSALARAHPILVGGRSWEIYSAPSQAFITARTTARPALAMVGGFLLTLAATGYLYVTLRSSEFRAALAHSERRFRTLVEHAPEGILVVNVQTRSLVDANRNACRMFGMNRAELMHSSLTELSAPVQPDGKDAVTSAQEHIREALAGGTPVFRWLHIGRDTPVFPCEVRLVRLQSTEGPLIRASITDISERIRSEERQTRLMRELDHRVKNNLATVMSLVEQSAANSTSVEELRASLAGRIHSIANVHSALARRHWSGMDFSDLCLMTLGPYNPANEPPRIRMEGPAWHLPADACASLCMVLHELATNAVKYGALSTPNGRVELTWSAASDDMHILWKETHGPPVREPQRRGYGTRLIEGLIEHEFDGIADVAYPSSGLRAHITIPCEGTEREASAA